MIKCPSCGTMNPDGEMACLACRTGLPAGAAGSARCPNGHPIDPSWTSCPYCARTRPAASAGSPAKTVVEGGPAMAAGAPAGGRATRLEGSAPAAGGPAAPPAAADRRTRLEGEAAGGAPPLPSAGAAATRLEGHGPLGAGPPGPGAPPSPAVRPTRLEEPAPPARGRQTVLHETSPAAPPPAGVSAPGPPPVAQVAPPQPVAAPPPATSGAADSRRLVAVLAAPDLQPGGAVFAIRAGKNAIGADPACEVCLSTDSEVSGEHALILQRGGQFYLADRMSTNGTWVNGEEVDPTSNAVVLQDRDTIRCGRTEMVFLTLEPTTASGPGGPSAAGASPELTQQGG